MYAIKWHKFGERSLTAGQYIIVEDHEGNRAIAVWTGKSPIYLQNVVMGMPASWATCFRKLHEPLLFYYEDGSVFDDDCVMDNEISFKKN